MKKALLLCTMLAAFASFAVAAPTPYLGAYSKGAEADLPTFDICDEDTFELDCPEGENIGEEGEFCPSLQDQTNGGCFCDPPLFSDIACGDTICGTSFSRLLVRDTDWYRLEVGEGDTVRVTAVAEFPVLLAILSPTGEDSCEDLETHDIDDSECPGDTASVAAILDAGVYYIFVAPVVFGCAVNCQEYVIWVECDEGEGEVTEFDMGDLEACYPTLVMNPAHGISGIAWLGAAVDAEDIPDTLDNDEGDDGVEFLNTPWLPCTDVSIQVTITAGDNFENWDDTANGGQGGQLYLNVWKDGNLDCDFCDTLCDEGGADEWAVQNLPVEPGTQTVTFTDPGVFDMGRYHGHVRVRLSGEPLAGGCGEITAVSLLGEVEDYIIEDLQLAVELMGGLLADAGDGSVTLRWTTASETNNDHFEILRDGALIATRNGAGTSTSRQDYSYTDNGLTNGRTYSYKLVAVDANGAREEVAQVNAVPNAGDGVVTEYSLLQNYPNPFNPATSISFALLEDGFVTLKVYDLTGREVVTLVNSNLAKGRHSVTFDAADLPSGMYLYKITAGGFSATRKMLLMK